jgi:hypothetical protein
VARLPHDAVSERSPEDAIGLAAVSTARGVGAELRGLVDLLGDARGGEDDPPVQTIRRLRPRARRPAAAATAPVDHGFRLDAARCRVLPLFGGSRLPIPVDRGFPRVGAVPG